MDNDYGDSDSDHDEIGAGSSSDEDDDLQTLFKKGSEIGVRSGASAESSSFCNFDEEESFEDEVGKEFDAAFALVEHDAGLKTLPQSIKKDPLHDPRMDDRDQAWINARRMRYQPKRPAGGGLQKLPNSDAVLNCPCCMTMVCLDCQRHEKFTNQYRAMFVFNCTVNFEETLKIPAEVDKKNLKKQKWKGRKRKLESVEPSAGTSGEEVAEKSAESRPASGGDEFHPVSCSTCRTRLAVYDKEEIYHFFHVLASN